MSERLVQSAENPSVTSLGLGFGEAQRMKHGVEEIQAGKGDRAGVSSAEKAAEQACKKLQLEGQTWAEQQSKGMKGQLAKLSKDSKAKSEDCLEIPPLHM